VSLFFRKAAAPEVRSSSASELIPSRVGVGRFDTAVTSSTSQQVVAYASAVNLLSTVVASLPLEVFTGRGRSQRPARKPAWLDDPSGERYGLEDWLKLWMASAAYTGNVVLHIVARDGNQAPSVVDVVDMADVVVRSENGMRSWYIGGKKVPRENIVHYRRWPTPGKLLGQSPIERHASAFGVAIAAERFGQQWFAEGAHPSQVLTTEQPIDAGTAAAIKSRMLDALQGSRGPAVLGSGMKLEQFQVAPEESQFLETQSFTAAQVCRILGPGIAEILGYKTGDSMTYKNREQLALDLLSYAIDPWLVDLERQLSRMLGAPGSSTMSGSWVRFNRNALLRTDLLTRYQAHRIALGPMEPWTTANEVRDYEDQQPIVWGDDKPAVQGENVPTDIVDVQPAADVPRSLTVNVDARPGTTSVDARTTVHAELPPQPPAQIHNHVDVPTPQVSVEPRIEVAPPHVEVAAPEVHNHITTPTPTAVRKRVEHTDDGRIAAIIEEPISE